MKLFRFRLKGTDLYFGNIKGGPYDKKKTHFSNKGAFYTEDMVDDVYCNFCLVNEAQRKRHPNLDNIRQHGITKNFGVDFETLDRVEYELTEVKKKENPNSYMDDPHHKNIVNSLRHLYGDIDGVNGIGIGYENQFFVYTENKRAKAYVEKMIKTDLPDINISVEYIGKVELQ